MGIPKFFKWLTRRYPQILHNIKTEEECPPIDNLYLDLNGIVHNCIHGNDAKLHERVSQLDNFDEVWINIMKAIDELVHTIKPKKILFLAVDGVAPRAKMNQQRTRRFRTAKDSQSLVEKLIKEGKDAPKLFDSNAISPGTKFMEQLSKQLDFFVQYKQNVDPLYQKLEKIVLSDGFVPGEGEHKMMDFIRQAKQNPNHDPNTRHCFYGADADLIMLSLVTHEPNFVILREEHVVKKIKQGGVQRLDLQRTHNYQLIYINLLREYFHLEYSQVAPKMRMRFDLERIIDDFVFFCFFIGNDFLPSLISLDIGEGSLDNLIDLYKELLPQMSNYITEAGKIYWDRAEPFIRMLADHEAVSLKNRIVSMESAKNHKLISFDVEFNSTSTTIDRTSLIKQKIKQKLNEKKKKKILGLSQKKKDKQLKKFLLLKKFEEDEVNESLTETQRAIREQQLLKYKKLREQQNVDHNIQSQGEPISEEFKKIESLKELVAGLKEEYFSDLNVEDLDDDQVSDVDESELNLDDIQDQNLNQEIENKIQVIQDINDKYAEDNLKFMTEFIKMYHNDPEGAKNMYYKAKLKFDGSSNEGHSKKKRMLKKYIEGLQWVLYYYYKGAQHWRWYYPYHYAPMISDIDENIVQNYLSGKITIDQFDIDENCADVNEPYTPFQQLLSILPSKSLHLLPDIYSTIVLNQLKTYFPDDFDIDFNGRALPWEAICIIPFVDEKLFIDHEQRLLNGNSLIPEDSERNIISFEYKSYVYNKNVPISQLQPLHSSLKLFNSIKHNFSLMTKEAEYAQVGQYSFEPKLMNGVVQPCIDFPSFKYLNIVNVVFDEKVIHDIAFKRVLLEIPSCIEERTTEDLETFVNKFTKNVSKEIYVGFPFQVEAFPTIFEDSKFTFSVYGDEYTNVYKVHKDYQQSDADKWEYMSNRQKFKYSDSGFFIRDPKVFVSVSRVIGVGFDSMRCNYYKNYDETQELIPLSMILRKRDPNHYLNVNLRCQSFPKSYIVGEEIVCLNMHLFGVIGKVESIDYQRKRVKVRFDKEDQQSKIHDPFMGQKCLMQSKEDPANQNMKRYYSDRQIEQLLKLKPGIINKLTGSILFTYNDKRKLERQVIDLGLNVKNYTKKVHIAEYVRYVVEEDVADNQFDDYNHNYHARGAKHQRKHWEYSQECFEIIKEYLTKYKEVYDCLVRTMKQNKQMLSLKDIYYKIDPEEAVNRVREITGWLESLPISKLSYVEMGFDVLNQDLLQSIVSKGQNIKENFKSVELKCGEIEILDCNLLFQEQFPYWSLPFDNKSTDDFRVGDRVMNIMSVRREYVPFGWRGTVVGKTNDKIIVLFDEHFISGNNIYGNCENYRGGFINPNNLINLTKKFTSIINKNYELAISFQEQPLTGEEQEDLQFLIQANPEQEVIIPQQKTEVNIQTRQKPRQQKNPQQQQQEFTQQQQQPKYAVKKVEGVQQQQQQQVQAVQQQTVIHIQQEEQKINTFQQDPAITSVTNVYQQDPAITQINTFQPTTQQNFYDQQQQQNPQFASGFKLSYTQSNDYFYQDDVDLGQQEDYRVEEEEELTHLQAQQQSDQLMNNPDFQQLLNMMNLAQQMQQPLNLFGAPFGGAPASNLNLNAQEFVFNPSNKPKQEEEEKKGDDTKHE